MRITVRVIYKKVMHKADIYLHRPASYKAAKAALAEMIENLDDDEVVFLNRRPIGDTVYGLSSIDAYRQKYPNKRITVIGSERNKELIESYSGIDKVMLFPPNDESYRRMLAYTAFPKLCAQGAIHGIYATLPVTKKRGDLISLQRQEIFHLDDSVPITYHGLHGGGVSIEHFEEQKDKIVLINPYSTTMPHVTIPLYAKLCDILTSRGYIVYTNVVGDQKPVEGSKPPRCSVTELYSIACDIPLIVSVRSGILDLLAKSNINMFVMYEGTTKSRGYDRYHLSAWRCQGDVEEIYVGSKAILESVPDRFIEYLERLGLWQA